MAKKQIVSPTAAGDLAPEWRVPMNLPPSQEQAVNIDASAEPAANWQAPMYPAPPPPAKPEPQYITDPAQLPEQALSPLERLYRQTVAKNQMTMPNIPGNSLEWESKASMSDKESHSQKLLKLLNAKETAARYQTEAEANPLYAQLQSLLSGQKASLASRANDTVAPDLSGIMNTVDAWTGSKMSANYKPPVDKLAAMTEDYQKNLVDLYAKQQQGLAAQKAGETNDAYIKAITQANTQKSLDPDAHKSANSKEDVNFWKFLDHFQGDTVVKDAVAARDTVNQLRGALKSRNWLTDGNIRGMIVELRKLKPVSDRDLNQAAGRPDLMSSVERAINKYVLTGELFSQSEAADIEQWVNTLGERSQKIINAKAKLYRTKIAPGISGLNKDAANTALDSVTSTTPYDEEVPKVNPIFEKYRKKK